MADTFPTIMKTINSQIQEAPPIQAQETWRKPHQSVSLSNCLTTMVKRKMF